MITSQIKKYTLLILLIVILTGCPYGYKYNQGFLPTSPVNLEDFNTEYDDYNLDIPVFGTTIPVLFSSNRNSLGEEYDIIFKIFEIWFDRDDGTLTAGKADNYTSIKELVILNH
jgi:hypothetical protein